MRRLLAAFLVLATPSLAQETPPDGVPDRRVAAGVDLARCRREDEVDALGPADLQVGREGASIRRWMDCRLPQAEVSFEIGSEAASPSASTRRVRTSDQQV